MQIEIDKIVNVKKVITKDMLSLNNGLYIVQAGASSGGIVPCPQSP